MDLSKKNPKSRARIATILSHPDLKFLKNSTIFSKIIFDKTLEQINEKGY